MPAPKKTSSPVGTALVGVALYEAVAEDLVESTGVRILPSLARFIETRSWRNLRHRLFPSWGPTVGFAALGLTISAMRAVRQKQQRTGVRQSHA